MIDIKKLLIAIAVIILVILMAITTSQLKDNRVMEQTSPLEKTTKEQATEDNNDNKKEITESVITKEDPVREFLSDNVRKAVQRFFARDLYVVSIGDSLTEGVGDDEENGGYVGVLEEAVNAEEQLVTIDNFGRRGNRTDQLINRLSEETDIIDAVDQADIILITIGSNDIMQVFKENFTDLSIDKFTSEQIRYEQRLHTIFTTLEDINPDASVYLIGFYNPFKEYFPEIEELEYIVNSWNQIGSDVTKEYDDTEYIPIKDLFEDLDVEFLANDNFHPNHIGYEMIAERILDYVTNEGEKNELFRTNEEE